MICVEELSININLKNILLIKKYNFVFRKKIYKSQNIEMLNETNSCGKWGLSEDQREFQEVHGWWVQGLGSVIIGCFGFVMNSITLYILTRQKLRKIFFNKLLICLTIFDILFIINGIYESYRLNMTKTNYCSMQGYVMVVLYPLRRIVLCCSIYMTIMLAFERYLAVSKPITYIDPASSE